MSGAVIWYVVIPPDARDWHTAGYYVLSYYIVYDVVPGTGAQVYDVWDYYSVCYYQLRVLLRGVRLCCPVLAFSVRWYHQCAVVTCPWTAVSTCV
eukprot:3448825-Rhodomonas_salina.3